MAIYAIGDVQGCYATLEALLRKLPLEASDRLWLAGDLVNRGPRSLDVLRWAKAQGERLTMVLGNHDLHLLGVACGERTLGKKDTLQPILSAPDREELLDWLAERPLLHREGSRVLVHAGLPAWWNVEECEAVAREIEERLRSPRRGRHLARLEALPVPPLWTSAMKGRARRALAIAAFTRMRACRLDGSLELAPKGPPASFAPGLVPWFHVPERRWRGVTVICGHWAALGLVLEPELCALDSGCVWGQQLTAVRLEDGRVWQQGRIDP